MAFDLVVKNGMIVDGSGLPRYRADIGVKDGKIAEIGRINGAAAKETMDADGRVVSPGFVDGHTHMDAQIFWDPIGTSSCFQGVTTVLMGNCGFTLAPCRAEEADLVMRNLERAEDISRAAMKAGIKWRWETFPEFLDVLESLPKGINYAGYMGHCALRTYVMGQRAFTDKATEDEIKAMAHHTRESIAAGAHGFSTTRSVSHMTSDDKPVASRLATWEEFETLVKAMGAGMVEVAGEPRGDAEKARRWYEDLSRLAIESGRPFTFGLFNRKAVPGHWRTTFDIMERTAHQGGRMFAQVHSRALNVLLSFETQLPFDKWDMWRDMRKLPLAEQKQWLLDADKRRRLVEIASKPYEGPTVRGAEARPPEWDVIYSLDSMTGPHKSMAELARQKNTHPVDLMIDMALERDLKFFMIQPIANEDQAEALELMKHPRSVVTFSDSGAHVSQIMDSSLQTHLLSHWVREKQAFTLEEAVKLITNDTATQFGFHDRGLLREGMAADIVVFDPDTVGPHLPEVVCDLPAGAKRLKQTCEGMHATIVNGQVLLRDNKPTGNLPGRLLRRKARG
ncbi:N-acyl-D-amino-acid deacylase family protein [Reyranella soli]|uniref:Amidohydrolase n=1 Tax=Reyranella soli TaxID=1230389 RepID=A0A512NES1_9HYPH|nr:amidohydrolase family protein [Reyranella soli]GEP57455.1 amidohydrolase [Reyranella soli]